MLEASSDLIDAMILHIHHLIDEEHRPFSYLDFTKFQVKDEEYRMTMGRFEQYLSVEEREV